MANSSGTVLSMGDTVVQIGTVGTVSGAQGDSVPPTREEEAATFWSEIESRVALRAELSYRRPNNRQERRRR